MPKEGFLHKLCIDKELMANQLLETLLENKYKQYILINLNVTVLGLDIFLNAFLFRVYIKIEITCYFYYGRRNVGRIKKLDQ